MFLIGIKLALNVDLPEGWKLNKQAPMRYRIEAEDQDGPVDRTALGKTVVVSEDQRRAEFTVQVPVRKNAGRERLKISLGYYYCREGAEGVCKVGSVTWTVPVTLAGDGSTDPIVLRHAVRVPKLPDLPKLPNPPPLFPNVE